MCHLPVSLHDVHYAVSMRCDPRSALILALALMLCGVTTADDKAPPEIPKDVDRAALVTPSGKLIPTLLRVLKDLPTASSALTRIEWQCGVLTLGLRSEDPDLATSIVRELHGSKLVRARASKMAIYATRPTRSQASDPYISEVVIHGGRAIPLIEGMRPLDQDENLLRVRLGGEDSGANVKLVMDPTRTQHFGRPHVSRTFEFEPMDAGTFLRLLHNVSRWYTGTWDRTMRHGHWSEGTSRPPFVEMLTRLPNGALPAGAPRLERVAPRTLPRMELALDEVYNSGELLIGGYHSALESLDVLDQGRIVYRTRAWMKPQEGPEWKWKLVVQLPEGRRAWRVRDPRRLRYGPPPHDRHRGCGAAEVEGRGLPRARLGAALA